MGHASPPTAFGGVYNGLTSIPLSLFITNKRDMLPLSPTLSKTYITLEGQSTESIRHGYRRFRRRGDGPWISYDTLPPSTAVVNQAGINQADIIQKVIVQVIVRHAVIDHLQYLRGNSRKVSSRCLVRSLSGGLKSLVGARRSRHADKTPPFIHLDEHHGGGWSSVYASRRSHIFIKFAIVPKKDKAELEGYRKNEKAAYDQLPPLTGWVIPRCYGECSWYGGRALVLTDEGRSLENLKMAFTSLGVVERCDFPQI